MATKADMVALVSPLKRYDERSRLRELLSLHILDTPAETRFDRYVHLVADIFDVPIALISLVDEKRQWFKAAVGLDVCETARDVAFCAHALPYELMEIADATVDPRFGANPLVTGAPHIRFYAGAVLHGPTGQPLGTLCLIDRQPRTLSQTERRRLKAFARLVEQELDVNARLEDLRNGLHRAAYYDAITGLPERWLVEEHLERILQEARERRHAVAVMHLHVASLEETVAVHGVANGDALLRELARRLHAVAGAGDIIGRLGADRFVLIISRTRSRSETSRRIRRVMRTLSHPFALAGAARQAKLSAGISSYPTDADSVEALLDTARTAAQASMATGPAAYQFYSRETHTWVSHRHDKAQRLADALKQDTLHQVYQPIVALDTGRIIGVEALARWMDERFGAVSPAEFVPLAEEDPGMRRALTRWALRTACRQAVDWHDQLGVRVRVVINIPGRELHRNDFARLVRTTLKQSGLPAHLLCLELTEQSLISDLDAAVTVMNALRRDGVRFAVDDFGTGYSSLSYLRKLPLDALKIDRSFITDVADDAVAHHLMRGIMDIARALGLEVIAEGVETESQLEAVQSLRCAFGQGFLFSRPEFAATVSQLLTTAQDRKASSSTRPAAPLY